MILTNLFTIRQLYKHIIVYIMEDIVALTIRNIPMALMVSGLIEGAGGLKKQDQVSSNPASGTNKFR